jgi:hypothetical protein
LLAERIQRSERSEKEQKEEKYWCSFQTAATTNGYAESFIGARNDALLSGHLTSDTQYDGLFPWLIQFLCFLL